MKSIQSVIITRVNDSHFCGPFSWGHRGKSIGYWQEVKASEWVFLVKKKKKKKKKKEKKKKKRKCEIEKKEVFFFSTLCSRDIGKMTGGPVQTPKRTSSLVIWRDVGQKIYSSPAFSWLDSSFYVVWVLELPFSIASICEGLFNWLVSSSVDACWPVVCFRRRASSANEAPPNQT